MENSISLWSTIIISHCSLTIKFIQSCSNLSTLIHVLLGIWRIQGGKPSTDPERLAQLSVKDVPCSIDISIHLCVTLRTLECLALSQFHVQMSTVSTCLACVMFIIDDHFARRVLIAWICIALTFQSCFQSVYWLFEPSFESQIQ